MGKQSTRENKTIYQLCREAAGLTRAEASDKMEAVSDSKIEKFEYETQNQHLTISFKWLMLIRDRISAIIIVLIGVKSDIVMFQK